MIDLKLYRENPQRYKDGAKNKNVTVDRETFDTADTQVRETQWQLDQLKAKRNSLSAQIQSLEKWSEEFLAVVKEVKSLKGEIATLEEQYTQVKNTFDTLLHKIPNPPFDDVIIWKSDDENVVLEIVGDIPEFDYEPKPHRDLLEAKWLLDQERAVKISGSRFQIMRGQFAQLQFALIQRVTTKLIKKWFNMTLVPQLVRTDAMFATWYLPNESTNLYRVNPKTDAIPDEQKEREEDDLRLIGTSEVPLIAQHSQEIFAPEQLPLRYVWYSSCFRREAGTYGKDTKGLIRVHQFDKIEMVSFVQPEDSAKEHEMLREIEEEIFQWLGIPYQRIDICTWDLWAPAAKKYDLEAWFPGIGKFKEVTSTSNTTDFQTRRANIKVKNPDGKVYAHSLNGTAVALGRALAALVENYQTADGDVMVPEVLREYVGFEKF